MAEDSFIPLPAAAVILHKELSGQSQSDPGVLDKVAAAIAKHARIYAREGWGDRVELVRSSVLQEAKFMNDGSFMRSRNVTYVDLCIRREDLPVLVKALTGWLGPKN